MTEKPVRALYLDLSNLDAENSNLLIRIELGRENPPKEGALILRLNEREYALAKALSENIMVELFEDLENLAIDIAKGNTYGKDLCTEASLIVCLTIYEDLETWNVRLGRDESTINWNTVSESYCSAKMEDEYNNWFEYAPAAQDLRSIFVKVAKAAYEFRKKNPPAQASA